MMIHAKRFLFSIFFLFVLLSTAVSSETVRYTFLDKSQIGFDAHSTLHSFNGTAKKLSGEFVVSWEGAPVLEKGLFVVYSDSLNTENKLRDNKMRRHHLEIEKYPLIEFTSEKCVFLSPNQYSLKGNLKLHGVTREIFLPVKVAIENKEIIKITGKTFLKLSDYNIPIPSAIGFIKMDDEVAVYFSLTAKSEKSES